jgi:hypothetical protein
MQIDKAQRLDVDTVSYMPILTSYEDTSHVGGIHLGAACTRITEQCNNQTTCIACVSGYF